MVVLTPLESELLAILRQNPLCSDQEISSLLKQSEEWVLKTKAQLKDKHVFLGYKALVNETAIRGSDTVIKAFVELTVQPQKQTGYDTIAKQIYSYPEVVEHYLFSGAYDFLVVVEGKSHYDIASFVSDKLATIEQVTSTLTHFVFKCYKIHGVECNPLDSTDRLSVVA